MDPTEAKAEQVLADVLELPAADRASAMNRACGDNRALRARVQELLDAFSQAGGFLADPTIDPLAVPPPLEPDRTTPLAPERPGTRIGRYKLLQQVGEGGFGIVFMAEQEHPVRRQVAIKVIKLGMDTREVVARFEAERQALAMMDHPNIAKVLDAGSTDAGRPYFVMELVRGSPITDYADKHKLSTTARVALAEQVCRAVQHAHSKGIIHRDLKPNNVLVTVTDDKPVPKVIDFGIAKATQARLTDRTLFTGFRQLIGTPQYMSPEQADSDGSDVDTRTDVYSLGVLLYELLVGTTPFDARALRSAALDAMRKIIREQDPDRPSTKLHTLGDTLTTIATNRGTDPKRLGQLLHGELDWIAMRALEKDRSRRYETAAALADDLRRYLSGEAVLAGPVSGAYRLRKLLRRHRAAVGIVAAVGVSLLLGVAGTSVGLLREAHQRHIADAQRLSALAARDEADAQRRSAQGVVDFLTRDVLARATPQVNADHAVSDTLVKFLIEPALKRADQRFADQPLVRASVQATLAQVLLDWGRYALALPQAQAAWQTRQHLLGEAHPDTIVALHEYAAALYNLSRFVEAEPLLRQAWEQRRRVWGADDPDTLRAMTNDAAALGFLNRPDEAADLYRHVWESQRRRLGADEPETIRALGSYAAALDTAGKLASDEIVLRAEADALRRVHPDDPRRGHYLDELSRFLMDQHRYAEAEPLLWECLTFDRAHPTLVEPTDPSSLTLLDQCRQARGEPPATLPPPTSRPIDGPIVPATSAAIAQALTAQGHTLYGRDDLTGAIQSLQRAAAFYRQSDPDNPNRDPDLYDLGRCLASEHDLPAAEAAYAELLAHYHGGHSSSDVSVAARTLSYLGHAQLDDGKPADAAATFAELLTISRGETSPNPLYIGGALGELGTALSELGPARAAEAEADLREALSTYRTWAGPRATWTLQTARRLAELLDQTGRAADAATVRAEYGLAPPASRP